MPLMKEEVELEEVESKYAAAIAAYKKKGGKVKKLKDSPAFKSLFKQKGPQKPPRKEEVEIDEGLYSIKNTKTGQRYSVSKYPRHASCFYRGWFCFGNQAGYEKEIKTRRAQRT